MLSQLALLLVGCFGVYPILWIFIDGARAIASDTAICVHACLDILSQCIFGMMLVMMHPPYPRPPFLPSLHPSSPLPSPLRPSVPALPPLLLCPFLRPCLSPRLSAVAARE